MYIKFVFFCIRLRNPWNSQLSSWTGKYSDLSSSEWSALDVASRESILRVNESILHGHFFMCYDDFYEMFDQIDMVCVSLTTFSSWATTVSTTAALVSPMTRQLAPFTKWTEQRVWGELVVGKNAGGKSNQQ